MVFFQNIVFTLRAEEICLKALSAFRVFFSAHIKDRKKCPANLLTEICFPPKIHIPLQVKWMSFSNWYLKVKSPFMFNKFGTLGDKTCQCCNLNHIYLGDPFHTELVVTIVALKCGILWINFILKLFQKVSAFHQPVSYMFHLYMYVSL